jgi:hypothetical protein
MTFRARAWLRDAVIEDQCLHPFLITNETFEGSAHIPLAQRQGGEELLHQMVVECDSTFVRLYKKPSIYTHNRNFVVEITYLSQVYLGPDHVFLNHHESELPKIATKALFV